MNRHLADPHAGSYTGEIPEICSLCDQRNDDRCSVCGCFLAEKAAWRSSECPLGKWNQQPEVSNEKLYFVIDSKSGLFPAESMREGEAANAACGRAHFKALNTDIEFCIECSYNNFSECIARSSQSH